MPFHKVNISGLLIFEPNVIEDNRGYFFESYNKNLFKKNGLDLGFVQDNQSMSKYGVIRGLHYQLHPNAQSKLIKVLHGKILDVAVDIRKGSPSFGETFSIELSAENKKQLFIPDGFAHGFSVLSEEAIVFYKCNAFYNKENEAGIRFDDPVLNIDWKIPIDKIIVSEKDMQLPLLINSKNNFEMQS